MLMGILFLTDGSSRTNYAKQHVVVWAATRVVSDSPSSSMLPSLPNSKGLNLMLLKKSVKGMPA